MKIVYKVLFIMISLGSGLLAKDVATITALKGEVNIISPSVKMAATLGAKLQERDSVLTANKSKAQLVFQDDTIVTIGKNSHFVIQKYLYDEKKPEVELGLFQGAMRTITGQIGKIAPSRFKVRTKTATIGIRGTNFTIIVHDDGSQMVLCTYGAIDVMYDNQKTLIKEGQYLKITKAGKQSVQTISSGTLKNLKKKYFANSKKMKKSSKQLVKELHIRIEKSVDSTTLETKTLEVQAEANQALQDAVQTQDAGGNIIEYRGLGANSSAYEGLATLTLKMYEDTTFIAEDSFVSERDDLNDVTWRYGDVSGSLVSGGTFGSVSSTSSTASDFVIDTTKNALTETEDISVDDAMHWGTWAIKVDYTDDGYPNSRESEGLWVAGTLTDSAVLANYTQQNAAYVGKYRAYDTQQTSTVVEDIARVDVDFSADTALLVLEKSGDVLEKYTLTGVKTGVMTGNGTLQSESEANGYFYGATGNNIGGNFTIKSGSQATTKGVYEVSTSEALY